MVPTPTVTDLLRPLVEVDDRGVRSDDGSYSTWRQHIQDGADLPRRCAPGSILASRRTSACCWGTPAVLRAVGGGRAERPGACRPQPSAARCRTGPGCRTRRLSTGTSDTVDSVEVTVPLIDVASESWTTELGISWCSNHIRGHDIRRSFMLIFTSGTSGEPKAVRCTHEKVAVPGVMMIAERFRLGPSDTRYLSMPMFHSNAPWPAGRPRWQRECRLPCAASFPLHSSFQTSGGSKPPTPTTWASRCPTSWLPRARRRRRQSPALLLRQ